MNPVRLHKHIQEHAALGISKRNAQSFGKFRVAVLGDSISGAYLLNFTDSQKIFYNTGYLNWCRLFSNQTIFFDDSLAHGVLGDTTTEALARVGTMLISDPDITIVLIGTNDVVGAETAIQSIANLTSIYTQILSAGKICIAVVVPPRNGGTETTAQKQKQMQVAEWQRQWCPRNNVLLADPTRYWLDPVTADADPHTEMVASDLIHPTQKGGYWLAVSIWDILKTFIPVAEYGNAMTPLDLYDAINFPLGNLLANGDLSGVGGTKTGINPATGNIADSWNIHSVGASATSFLVGSMDDKDTGTGLTYKRQKFVYSNVATGATEEYWFNQTIDVHNPGPWDGTDKVQEGDQVYCEVEIEIVSPVNINGVSPRLVENDGTDNFLVDDMATKQISESIPFGYRAKLRTPVHTIRDYSGSGNVSLSLRIVFDVIGSANATCEFYIGTPVVRKLSV